MRTDTVTQIKNKLSIVDVVSPYVKLLKAGRVMKGLCPFHKEKTPSFVVSLERDTYHCFGCGEGGDAFSFIEKIEGVDFKGALKILADKAGVGIVYDPAAQKAAKGIERLRETVASAAGFYTSNLTSESEAYKYALSRGLTKETIKEWQLGFAPDDWRQLLEHLTGKGFKTGELSAAGLIKEAEGKRGTYYDRFRNRLIFPIRDSAGRTVAFTGRTLESGSRSPEVGSAKYLNSPESELYHKSEILFGLDRAKEAIRTRKFALLVEGQMDLLHAHQIGFTNAVALSGTAFTEGHAKILSRYSENLMLMLDADSAGLEATRKSALAALAQGMKVKIARVPIGKDPADLASEDPKEFAKQIKEAKPVVEFFLALLLLRERDPHRLVLSAEKIVLPLIRVMKSPMEQEHFVGAAARSLGLSPEAVRASLAKIPASAPQGGALSPSRDSPAPAFTRSSRQMREETLRAVVGVYPNTPLEKRIRAEYARIVEAPFPKDPPPEAALFEAEAAFGEAPEEHAADDLLSAFEESVIREAYQEKVADLRRAEAAGDRPHIEKAQKAVAALSARLAGLSRA